jgi:hypothetical protein
MTDSENTSEGHGGYQPPSYDDINTPVIVLVGAISALVTLLTIMFVQGLCYHWQNSYLKKLSAETENIPAVEQIDRQKEELVTAKVPIDEAMKKVVASYGK